MRIQVLHIEDCQNWEEAGRRLTIALARQKDTTSAVEFRLLRTAEETAAVPFAGSPTITVDGDDLFPGADRVDDLACRIYFTPDGLAGVPTVEQLVEAIDIHEQ
jgi:hypothetical protein